MNEQEENEFHKFWDKLCDDGYRTAYEAARSAWCEAKRNMPVIEIPAYDIHHYAPVRNIIAQLENFGIKYAIKGE